MIQQAVDVSGVDQDDFIIEDIAGVNGDFATSLVEEVVGASPGSGSPPKSPTAGDLLIDQYNSGKQDMTLKSVQSFIQALTLY